MLVDDGDDLNFSIDDRVLLEKNNMKHIIQKMIVVTTRMLFYLKEEINVMDKTINLMITLMKEKKTKIK